MDYLILREVDNYKIYCIKEEKIFVVKVELINGDLCGSMNFKRRDAAIQKVQSISEDLKYLNKYSKHNLKVFKIK